MCFSEKAVFYFVFYAFLNLAFIILKAAERCIFVTENHCAISPKSVQFFIYLMASLAEDNGLSPPRGVFWEPDLLYTQVVRALPSRQKIRAKESPVTKGTAVVH